MIGQNINAYFKAAMAYPIERLHAVLRNEDKSIPAAAAMMALPLKEREMAAAKGRQATQTQQQQQQQPNVREKMAQEVAALPENTGIMNLPTQTEFAEGGIVAFDDGGYVPGYAAAGAVDAELAGLKAEAAKYTAMIAEDPDNSPSAKAYLAHLNELIQAKQAKLGQVKPAGVAAIADKKGKKGPDLFAQNKAASELGAGYLAAVPPVPAAPPVDAAPPVAAAPVVPAAPVAESGISGQGLRRDSMLPVPTRSYSSNIAKKEKDITAQSATDELAKINNDLQSMPPGPQRTFLENRRDYLSGKVAPPNLLAAQNAEGSKIGLGYLAAAKAGEAQAVPSAAAGAVDKFKDARVSSKQQQQANANIPDPRAAYNQQGVGSLQQKAGSAGVGDLAKAYETVSKMGPDIEARYTAAEAAGVKSLEEANVAREAARPKEKAMEGMEKYMQAEEKAAKGKEARNLSSSLVAAGLAIAGGQSQYALQNIAQGAQVGTKQYNAGLDKLEDAAKERAKMMLQIEEARRAEARGDWKDVYDRKDKVNELQQSYKLKSIDALAKITGDDKKAATDIFTNSLKLASDERIAANAQAGATSRAISGDINALERAKLGVAGRTDIENVIRDNARQRASDWMRTGAGQMALAKDPNAGDIMFNKYLAEERAARQNQALLNPDIGAWGAVR